jgi:eukaryotic-like serine/threonine-protein kinase
MNNQQQDSIDSSTLHGQTDPPSRPLSRRAVLGGLAGLTGLAALGGGFAFWKYQRSHTALFTYTAQNEDIWTVAWSLDGKRIASGGLSQQTGSIHIWDALTGQHVVIYHDQTDIVSSVAWSPNGQLLASVSQDDLVVHVLRALNGTILLTYPHDAKGAFFKQRAVAWSPDGKRLASAGNQIDFTYNLQSWDALTGFQVMTYERSFRGLQLWGVAWSPDDRYLASVGTAYDRLPHDFLQVWDALTGRSVFISPWLDGVRAVSWASDSQRVVVGGNRTAQVWDISKHKLLYTYRGHASAVTTVAWSPDGTRIASGSKDVQVWNAKTGEQIFSYDGHSGTVRSVSWSPDSRYIASGGSDKTIQVWMPQ